MELLALRKELLLVPKLDNLADIERLDELKLGYHEQLKVKEEKLARLDKKLELVRDLVSEGKVEKLKSLIKKGEI